MTHPQPVVARATTPPKRNRLFFLWIGFLLLVLVAFAVGAVLTWTRGLEVTHLSNHVPWGLWITTDLSAVALGAGSFVIAALIYFFGGKQYAPLARVALLVGLLADTGTALILLLDLGRPDRFYHPVIYWNPKSLLWFITWCVILYIGVLSVELAPVLLESRWFARWRIGRWIAEQIHHAAPWIALLAVVISLVHQSAAGAAYGIVRGRPAWFDPGMPVIFLFSAVFASLSFLIALVLVTSRILRRDLVPFDLLQGLARIAGWVVIAYLVVRGWAVATSYYFSYKPFYGDSVSILYSQTPYSVALTVGEIFFGGMIPALIFLNPELRKNRRNLILGGIFGAVGVILNRWDITMSGLVTSVSYSPSNPAVEYYAYFPSWVEWVTVAGVAAYAALAYTLAIRFLPIFPQPEPAPVEESEGSEEPALMHTR